MEMKIFIVCGVFEHFDKLEQMLTQLLKLLIVRDQCDIYLSRSPAWTYTNYSIVIRYTHIFLSEGFKSV